MLSKKTAPLLAGKFYHIFNRTNNSEILFREDKNKRYFLNKYQQHLGSFLRTYAYCLLGNHFHFLVQVKYEEELLATLLNTPIHLRSKIQHDFIEILKAEGAFKKIPLEALQELPPKRFPFLEESYQFGPLVSAQFQRLFSGYSKAFNKRYNRQGNLFNRPFKRVQVQDEDHFTTLIYYIHANAMLHGIEKDFKQNLWSSYSTLISNQPTFVEREAVMDWFGGKKQLMEFHGDKHDLKGIQKLIIEN